MVVFQALRGVLPLRILRIVYIDSGLGELVREFYRHSVVSLAVLRVFTSTND